MPSRPTGVTDTANADAVLEVDVVERPSPDLFTTTTADPGSAGTTLAVTANAKFPSSGNYKIRVEAEVMRVTAGQGTNSWTVTRGIDGTTAVAHTTGVIVAHIVGVQRVEPVDASRIVTYRGRVNAFRTPARVATTQNILSLHNATGSTVKVRVNQVWLDFSTTVVKAVTVLPPVARLHKVTVLPTNGTAMTKVPQDSALTSSASVTSLGDASADGTGSTTTLTATIPSGAIFTQEFVARLITGAGYEPMDRLVFLEGDDTFITLNALEGVVLQLVSAVSMVATDMFIAGIEWEEYTVA